MSNYIHPRVRIEKSKENTFFATTTLEKAPKQRLINLNIAGKMPKKTQLNPKLEAIFSALEDSRFEWRTVNGVATDTKLSREEVLEGLIQLIDADVVIRSEVPSAKGEELFTTRDHYRKFSSIAKRIGAALRNRAS